MCLLADEGQPALGKPEDDTYVTIIPKVLMDPACRKCQESSLAATDFSNMCMVILARSGRTYGLSLPMLLPGMKWNILEGRCC